MPRAKRHYIPGQIWHLTHRCHKREFLLKLIMDRRKWVQWLYKEKKKYGLVILNYIVTSNQTIGMDAMLVFFYAFLDEKKESASVLFVKKNILTGVTSQDDMVTSARIMESRFSWHGSQRNSRMPTCQSR
jgi:hypothetical protein